MSRVHVALLMATLALPVRAFRQTKSSEDAAALRGAETFKTHCASCHGVSARGDGPMADALRFAPADLTAIARKNGGKFPAERVAKIIDGRESMKGHGGTDMPIWGDVFKSHVGYDEKRVKATISDLVQYLSTVQERAPR